MKQDIIVLAVEEILNRTELFSCSRGWKGYYPEESFALMRPLLQHFGSGNDLQTAKVVILVTSLCGCCGGDSAVNTAAKKLHANGYQGVLVGRTVADEQTCDGKDCAPKLYWCQRCSTPEQIIVQAEMLANY